MNRSNPNGPHDMPDLARLDDGRERECVRAVLRGEVIVGIVERQIPGFHRIDVLRREIPDGNEFTTLMWFDDVDAVRAFAGEDYEKAVVPLAARRLLTHFDERSAHCQVLEQLESA